MTIVGKSRAALSMIFDAIKSNPFPQITEVKIFNNLKIEGDFIYNNKKIAETEILNDFEFVLGAVMPETKRKLVNLFNLTYQTLINKTAFISGNAKTGSGTIIDGLAYISNGAVLGKYVTIYSGAVVSHDCKIGDYVTVCPGAVICGDVEIGEGTFIGAGATIRNGIGIGRNCFIGSGSNVVEGVAENGKVYGNPARRI